MNNISFNLGYILFNALVVWVFLANHFYLKIFFLKVDNTKNKKRQHEKLGSTIFDQVFGGETVPQYIKDAILKCQDKYQLLSLYMASKSIIDIGIYNKVVKDESIDKYEFCAKIFINSKHSAFNWLVWTARFISIFVCLGLCFIFFDKVFISKESPISNICELIIFSIFSMFILMPYNIYSKIKFFDKLCSVFVFLSSIVVALFSIIYIQEMSDDFIFNKFFLSIFLVNLILIIGAYSYVGYVKLEYMVKFFELLKINLKENVNDGNTVTDSTVSDPDQTTSS
ncbi:hypothetical protein GJV03_04605 [Acinetobacter sp. RIT698]|uniref:hypothetical protein n=1 Tax=Acinetobacter sp. RIT698 TaxID=2666192 RepID=UPI0012AD1DE9|nr:hypothetical protein [Acinetobacter sp. RIT698]MRT36443.1 hypothetical protein [Acinetobacter sp. RIT698]